jgi:hypothetical protein
MAALVAASGCATPHYGARTELFGEQITEGGRFNEKVDRVTDAEARSVRVFVGALPPGFERGSEGIKVSAGYGHRVIGMVSTTGLHGYNDDRRGLCGETGTAGRAFCMIGFLFAGFGYIGCGCFHGNQSNSPEDIELRRNALVAALQRATRSAGGNAVIVDGLGRTTTIDRRTGDQIGEQEMTHARGWAVELKESSVSPPPGDHGQGRP